MVSIYIYFRFFYTYFYVNLHILLSLWHRQGWERYKICDEIHNEFENRSLCRYIFFSLKLQKTCLRFTLSGFTTLYFVFSYYNSCIQNFQFEIKLKNLRQCLAYFLILCHKSSWFLQLLVIIRKICFPILF